MSWVETTLGEIITLKRGYDLPKAQRIAGEVPIVSSSGITGFHNKVKIDAPGVVTGRYGTLGKVYYLERSYWPLNTALYVRDFKNNDPRFISYFLQHVLKGTTSNKAAVPGVNRNDLHARKVFFPDSIKIQHTIATFLNWYDNLIENNNRRIQLLEQSAQLLYKEWFVRLRFPGHEHVKIVDGVPEGWSLTIIDQVCATIGGGTPSTKNPQYWNGGDITWAVPTDVTRNNCLALIDTERKITEAGLKGSSAKMVSPETILMTSRASIGFFAMMDQEVCTNQGFINIIPQEKFSCMFLLHNLMHRVEEIRSHASGSTFKEISKGRFRQLPILLPHKFLLQEFEDAAYRILQQVRLLKKQQLKLAEARDILLPRLMNGDIAV